MRVLDNLDYDGDVRESTAHNYFQWLCELVGITQRDTTYFLLAKDLYNKEFKWFVPNDDNRAFEGRALRERFCEEADMYYNSRSFGEDVSLFEVIVGLACRCESITDMHVSKWFWEMMKNAGLDKFTDDVYYEIGGAPEVNYILDRIINRTYHRSGKGGLFPLRKTKNDQRKVEVWYQMNEYLVENYYSEDEVV
jgi:hypothetical protein